MKKRFILLMMLIATLPFAVKSQSNNELTLKVENYNDWGWECLVIENGFIELVIIPEIGGRVLRYAFPGDQQMAINPRTIGQNFDPATDSSGPWAKGWGYGGYKNWPAPQSFWNWPPPPRLCWGPYAYNIEHQSADSLIIYLESEVETIRAKGLKQARRFIIYRNSTLVKVEQYLFNVSATPRELSIWDISQTIVQHGTEKDMTNFSVYFPAEKSKINDANLNITEVADNVYRYKDTSKSGKAFINLNAGWCANVDERDSESYYKLFEIDPEANHPDDNSNFEIYTDGKNEYIEIEVLSPLKRLEHGDTLRYDQFWSAARVKGIHYQATIAGSVISPLAFDEGSLNLSGEYGIFSKGKVAVKLFNSNNNSSNQIEAGNVDASQLFTLNQTATGVEDIDSIAVVAFNEKGEEIGLLDHWTAIKVNVNKLNRTSLLVYPTVIEKGQQVTIQTGDNTLIESLNLVSANGQLIKIIENHNIEGGKISVPIPSVTPGIYFIQVKTRQQLMHTKLIVH